MSNPLSQRTGYGRSPLTVTDHEQKVCTVKAWERSVQVEALRKVKELFPNLADVPAVDLTPPAATAARVTWAPRTRRRAGWASRSRRRGTTRTRGVDGVD